MPMAYHAGQRAVFLYGFAKRERENIDADELATLREIGTAHWLAAGVHQIAQAIEEGVLQQVTDDEGTATYGRVGLARLDADRGPAGSAEFVVKPGGQRAGLQANAIQRYVDLAQGGGD